MMILITGGTGTSGAPIVKALLDRAERVRVLVRDVAKAATVLGDEVEISHGDLSDPQSIEAAMEDVDRALLNSSPTPDLAELQSAFIDAAGRCGVKHVVKFSVAGADPQSQRTFAKLHGRVEDELRDSGLAWTMLRPTFFMQNLFAMAGMIKSGAIYQPAGEGRAPFVDVRDIAAVAAAALSEPGHGGKVYDITGPHALSYRDVAQTFTNTVGHEVKYRPISFEDAKNAMLQMGMSEWSANAINDLSQALQDGAFDRVTNVVRDVGKKEPTTLVQFIQENVALFR
jgi:uncharacterized protein YbjT (DUF2867 family)